MNQFNRTSEKSREQPPVGPLRVLVVEDNAILGMLFADLLEEMGHVVCAIETSEDNAVAVAVQGKPDLLLVDVTLADGSGSSAVDKILRHRFIPHIFVSGDAQSVLADKPAAIVLQKPFRSPDLTRAIRRALDKKDVPRCHSTLSS